METRQRECTHECRVSLVWPLWTTPAARVWSLHLWTTHKKWVIAERRVGTRDSPKKSRHGTNQPVGWWREGGGSADTVRQPRLRPHTRTHTRPNRRTAGKTHCEKYGTNTADLLHHKALRLTPASRNKHSMTAAAGQEAEVQSIYSFLVGIFQPGCNALLHVVRVHLGSSDGPQQHQLNVLFSQLST